MRFARLGFFVVAVAMVATVPAQEPHYPWFSARPVSDDCSTHFMPCATGWDCLQPTLSSSEPRRYRCLDGVWVETSTFSSMTDTPSAYGNKGQYTLYVTDDGDGITYEISGKESTPTGLIDGGEITISADPAEVDISAGLAMIVDSYTRPFDRPTARLLSWPDLTEVISLPATAGQRRVLTIKEAIGPVPGPTAGHGHDTTLGELAQYVSRPGQEVVRDEIQLGYLVFNGTDWIPENSPIVLGNAVHAFNQYLNEVAGPIFITSGGFVTEAVPINLDLSSGEVFQLNISWQTNQKDPDTASFPAQLSVPWLYTNRDLTIVEGPISSADPSRFDNGVAVVAVPGGAKATTVQRFYRDLGGVFFMLWGQNTYSSYSEAVAQIGADTAMSEIPGNLSSFAYLLGYVVCEKNALAWADDQCRFLARIDPVSGGGGGTGGGDVVGPASVIDNNVAIYNGTTGKLLDQPPIAPEVGFVMEWTASGATWVDPVPAFNVSWTINCTASSCQYPDNVTGVEEWLDFHDNTITLDPVQTAAQVCFTWHFNLTGNADNAPTQLQTRAVYNAGANEIFKYTEAFVALPGPGDFPGDTDVYRCVCSIGFGCANEIPFNFPVAVQGGIALEFDQENPTNNSVILYRFVGSATWSSQ